MRAEVPLAYETCGVAPGVEVAVELSLCTLFPTDDLIQLTAMCWMREFIQLAGRVMLPYSSGVLTAVLPCLSYDDRKKSICSAAPLAFQGVCSPGEAAALLAPQNPWGWVVTPLLSLGFLQLPWVGFSRRGEAVAPG